MFIIEHLELNAHAPIQGESMQLLRNSALRYFMPEQRTMLAKWQGKKLLKDKQKL